MKLAPESTQKQRYRVEWLFSFMMDTFQGVGREYGITEKLF